jgi:dCMP deaminase
VGKGKVNVYIDGYNLYGAISRGSEATLKLGWCNYYALAEGLACDEFPGYSLGGVKYYTAKVPESLESRSGEHDRQRIWMEALQLVSAGEVEFIFGYWRSDSARQRVEKQTDIRLAVGLVRDALLSNSDPRLRIDTPSDKAAPFDAAIVISADRDFLPAVELANSYGKDVVVYLPPGLKWTDRPPLVRDLKEEQLAAAALPDSIPSVSGAAITWAGYLELRRKSKWKANESSLVAKSHDQHWLEQCEKRSLMSHDQRTKIGCVIVGPENEERSSGSNQFPSDAARSKAGSGPNAKYQWIEHAERNAIYAAAMRGTRIQGCTLYTSLPPCIDCAKAMIQAGIIQVVISQARTREYTGTHYREEFDAAKALLEVSRIHVRYA